MRTFLEVKFDQYKEDFGLQDNSETTNWRRFVNYHFFSQFQPGRLDTDDALLDQICVDSSRFSQVHGALFLLNDQILSGPKDIDDILQGNQKGLLELYFLTFGDVNSFMKELEMLFQDLDMMTGSEDWLNILAYAMSEKVVLQWKDNPRLRIIVYSDDSRTEQLKFSDKFTNYFSAIDSIGVNKKRLQELVNSNENSYRAELDCKTAWMIPGGNERPGNAYIACIPAQELIKLIITPDGLIRRNMFDDNVRDSQGFSTVNQEILSTLRNYPDRFVLFNNGITVVCTNATTENGKYVLENPQIVNGCQTCNMIYQAYREGACLDDVQIIAKIVGSDEEVTQGIVRGANRQNIVCEEAFETIRGFHKNLEKYFENNEVKGYQKIYYERRSRQYASNIQIKPQQKIGFRGLIQTMVALFLNHVEDSHRHEYKLLTNYKDSLFMDTHSCQPYYLAAFLYLNVDNLFREGTLPQDFKRYKMHIILLIKELIAGPSPDLASNDIDLYCERLLEALEHGRLDQCALEACDKFDKIRKNWVRSKGEQYRSGIKDSAEFRRFLVKEIYGTADEHDTIKLYTGYVMSIKLDKHDTVYGFIQHIPNNVFFHEFDNPGINESYVGKKVSYQIARNGNQERAINVRLMESAED